MTYPVLNIGHLHREFNIPLTFIARVLGCTDNWISIRKSKGESLTFEEGATLLKAVKAHNKKIVDHLEMTLDAYVQEYKSNVPQ